jgi:hypothetical protein
MREEKEEKHTHTRALGRVSPNAEMRHTVHHHQVVFFPHVFLLFSLLLF